MAAVLICLQLLTHAHASETFSGFPIATHNRSPVIQLFNLTRPDKIGKLLPGQIQLDSQLDVANYLSSTRKADEYFFIDGETWTLTQGIRYAPGANVQLGLYIPIVGHGRGISDKFIYTFHDVLQLPQNGRTDDHHDLLNWRLDKNADTVLQLNDSGSDPGDIRLQLAWRDGLSRHWQAELKLPTGDFEEQSGSEAFDFGIAVLWENPRWLSEREWLRAVPLSVWYGAGINYLGESTDLAQMNQQNIVATARAGMAWRVRSRWQLKTQLDSNTAVFSSNIRELGWIPVQISFATAHNMTDTSEIEFSLTEDLRPRVTPDIIFSLKYRHIFE